MVHFKAIVALDKEGGHPHDCIPKLFDSKLTHTVVTFFVNFILSSEVWQKTFGEGII